MCAYYVHVHESINMSLLNLRLTRIPTTPDTAVARHSNLATYDDMRSPMSVRLEIIKRATEFLREADKTLTLAQRRYKKSHVRRVLFANLFRVADFVFFVRPHFSSFVTERSALEGYNTLLARKQWPHKLTDASYNTLRNLQNSLSNAVSIHRDSVSSTPKCHCNNDPYGKKERCCRKAAGSDERTNKYQ